MEFWLPLIWAGIIALGVFIYVCLDGFDLGIGILFLTRSSQADRDVMMNTVAPVWDGNETWLIIGGAGLMGTFPLAYAILMPALYLPVIFMLIALVFRGVAFEFRFKADSSKVIWDRAFFIGSTVATFFQGVMLGAFVQGFTVVDGAYAGGAFDWLTTFSVTIGLALIAGYALLGACWLNMKTVGDLNAHARRVAIPLLIAVLTAIGLVSLWMIAFEPWVRERWFTFPNIVLLSPVPLATVVVAYSFIRSIRKKQEVAPYILALGLFALGYLGLAVSQAPYIVPPSISFWDAASAPETQLFMLIGALICLPVILGYTAYVYRIFHGKVTPETGYH